MAQILKTFLDPHKILRCLDGIVDVEDDDATWLYELTTTDRIWSDSGPNAIALDPTHCEEALVKYELWDSEPPVLLG
ncbi:hypothetical protein SAMN05421874_1536 [Nonomuraea maritima]|uniref:Uncharacterized protein n=1 Tax=Nonomuraea maritima TaxID=683260 RepID=A0A1G9S794_9ACTN|nr:hypothetical protein [Nonomuraea maritima]SDM31348.1 hypothetical protein SAMN05421874_1536 [Nonomuraea maritima]